MLAKKANKIASQSPQEKYFGLQLLAVLSLPCLSVANNQFIVALLLKDKKLKTTNNNKSGTTETKHMFVRCTTKNDS